MAQRLPEEEAHQSKMTEFGLTLDGRAAFWHSQMDLLAIKTFDALKSAFLRFFHKKVPQHTKKSRNKKEGVSAEYGGLDGDNGSGGKNGSTQNGKTKST